MRLLIIFAAVISVALAKPVQSITEIFECYANHLRDNNLLDKDFEYYVQSEPLDCQSTVQEFRDFFLNTLISEVTKSSEETGSSSDYKEMIRGNAGCFKEQLTSLKYPELMMTEFVYKHSSKLKKKDKKKLLKAIDSDSDKMLKAAYSICYPEDVFGELFDNIINGSDKEDDLEGQQSDYCARKYMLDNNLVDTAVYPVNVNPNNLELNFDCTDHIEEAFELLEEAFEEEFEYSNQSRKNRRCLRRKIRENNALAKILRLYVLSEVTMTDDQKKAARAEYVEDSKNLYLQFVKCYV